jgi:hypothetical protein
MKKSGINRVKAATVALVLAAVVGGPQVPQANATTMACGSGLCFDFQNFGDLNYTEVGLSGAFKGPAQIAFTALRLCDEKSDQIAATATITVAERRVSDGAVSYRQYPNLEYSRGPAAGCGTFNPPDLTSPTGKYAWAERADYSYKSLGMAASARAQTYHTAWVYNAYLRDWCPTCKSVK